MTVAIAILLAVVVAALLAASTWGSVSDKMYEQGKQPTAGEFGCTLLLFPVLLVAIAIVAFLLR